MAKRCTHSLEFTPNYGWMGEPILVTIKLYYNVAMETNSVRKMYKEEVGCMEKIGADFNLHKVGKSMNNGRYLESDADMVEIRNHVPKNFEVEIYFEHDEFISINR
ncbi:uncharacterized protein LOC142534946 [Primulina tabacum]|uniref:uncharacterized protein LOC142534946 n=1 Tax=Primulina tabacum TaxID=48773 RepID=UPI003F59234A